VGCHEHGNEASGSTIGKEFIDQANDYQFLKVLAPMELDGQSALSSHPWQKRRNRHQNLACYT
jgi:hypothetical protein